MEDERTNIKVNEAFSHAAASFLDEEKCTCSHWPLSGGETEAWYREKFESTRISSDLRDNPEIIRTQNGSEISPIISSHMANDSIQIFGTETESTLKQVTNENDFAKNRDQLNRGQLKPAVQHKSVDHTEAPNATVSQVAIMIPNSEERSESEIGDRDKGANSGSTQLPITTLEAKAPPGFVPSTQNFNLEGSSAVATVQKGGNEPGTINFDYEIGQLPLLTAEHSSLDSSTVFTNRNSAKSLEKQLNIMKELDEELQKRFLELDCELEQKKKELSSALREADGYKAQVQYLFNENKTVRSQLNVEIEKNSLLQLQYIQVNQNKVSLETALKEAESLANQHKCDKIKLLQELRLTKSHHEQLLEEQEKNEELFTVSAKFLSTRASKLKTMMTTSAAEAKQKEKQYIGTISEQNEVIQMLRNAKSQSK